MYFFNIEIPKASFDIIVKRYVDKFKIKLKKGQTFFEPMLCVLEKVE
jgi:hypothetical protein